MSLIPLVLFLTLFLSSGLYFSLNEVQNPFYQISPLIIMLPSIALGWSMYKGNQQTRASAFIDGVRNPDIIMMCIVFLLAGAFSEVMSKIGAIPSVVNLLLTFIPSSLLLIGLFITGAFISTAIGTSMGTIATLMPLATALSLKSGLQLELISGTILGSAMFGDNLSLISDTTVAAVSSQAADPKKKFYINAKLAFYSSAIVGVLLLLLGFTKGNEVLTAHEYSLFLISPYILLLILSMCGVGIFRSLVISIIAAGIVGIIEEPTYHFLDFANSIVIGFRSMNEIMILSLMIGGLSGLMGNSLSILSKDLTAVFARKMSNKKACSFAIALIIMIFDVLLANNTIAIIVSGKAVKEAAIENSIPLHYSAALLDVFSCIFQGIIPYGAQVLLVSGMTGISPLVIPQYVYYCHILLLVSILHITLCADKVE
ncbi:Na+/H+ antiporter NhaC family protein [Candidatus Fokinia crypta]|uniref:Cation antiporter n=1 Tax=Candidatus Fokinia crypta TaxID=1920990 RepID=A0ABZ0UQA8_9RICK|nr:Na+/H+ antiporter NhaC family protein [Candidatus Fokinia cryptica]WPX97742.1 Cation antiporter [Candidatus Fokinia cryptica]